MENKDLSVIISDKRLSVINPEIQSLAARCKWKPETLIRRIEATQLTSLEQNLYVFIMQQEESSMRPESFEHLLRVFSKGQKLIATDISFTKNYEKIDEIVSLLNMAFDLRYTLKEIGVSVSTHCIAMLVWIYDKDIEKIIEIIENSIKYIKEKNHLYINISDERVMGMVLSKLVKHIDEGAIVSILTSEDVVNFFFSSLGKNRFLHERLEEVADEQ